MSKIKTMILVALLVLSTTLVAQTNPTPQAIPYSQNFSSLDWTSTTYPEGWQGWILPGGPSASFNVSAPARDTALRASTDASWTGRGIHNYDGKIGFLNASTGSTEFSIALAVNTTGYSNIPVQYDIMTIRNPYDGIANTRINEVTLQYRVGTSGNFTNLTGIEYQNNTIGQTGAVTTPQNLQTKNITLPSECNNQPVVQLRWSSRQISGAGSRPSFAVDNISIFTVSGNQPPTISNVTRIPATPLNNVPVVIRAKIYDDYCPLANIRDSLFYAINDSSSWTRVYRDSVRAYDSTFYYRIPGQTTGNTVYYYVWAKDDSGASRRTPTASYSIPTNQPPVITNVYRTPFSPGPLQAFTVEARVTDDFAPTSALSCSLKYVTNPGATDTTWTAVAKDSVFADTFYFMVPGQANGTKICYYVWAKDDSGASSRSATYSYTIVTAPIIRILMHPRYIQGGATTASDSGTPFAIYAGVQAGTAYDTFNYKGRIGTRGLTWNADSSKWATDTDAWLSLSTVACGLVTDTSKLWVIMKARPTATVDTFVTVRMRRVGAATNYDSDTVPAKVLGMSSTGDGGWLYGHIYESNGGPLRENVVVLAYQGAQIVGSYITENNNINEGYALTDAGYIRMAVKSGQIDSLQVRNRYTNALLSYYTQAAGPWTVYAGGSTSLDQTLDVGVMEVTSPAGSVAYGSTIIPKAKIKNYGNVPALNIDVIFSITEAKAGEYTDTVTVSSLAVGEELLVSFESYQVTGAVGATFNTQAKTVMVGDANPLNDILPGSGFVVTEPVTSAWTKLDDSMPAAYDLKPGKSVKDGASMTVVNAGDFTGIYAFHGNKSRVFRKYTTSTKGLWADLESIPFGYKYPLAEPPKINTKKIGKGASLCWDGANKIYAVKGNGTKEFWAYYIDAEDTIPADEWIPMPFIAEIPKGLKGGASICYYNGNVYLLAGGQKVTDNNFYKYEVATNTWSALNKDNNMIPDNKPYKDGSCIVQYGGNIYALKGGGKNNYFYTYNIDGNFWNPTPDSVPLLNQFAKKIKIKDGAAMTVAEDNIYLIKGGGKQDFYKYTIASGAWAELETVPKGLGGKKRVPKTGAALVYYNGLLYLLKGNNYPEFWTYGPLSKSAGISNNHTIPSTTNPIQTQTITKTSTLLHITPNPMNRNTIIRYAVLKGGNVSMKLYNTNGTLVKTLLNRYQNSGEYILNLTNIAKGVYFVKYEANNEKSEVKLIVQ